MLSANLLPIKNRTVFRYEKWRRFTIVIGVFLYSALSAGLLFLLPIYLPILFQQNELERLLALEEHAFRNRGTRGTRARVQTIQALLSAVHARGAREHPLSRAFENILAEAVSPSLTLVSITIQNDGVVSLVGKADTRADLLDFERRLRASSIFRDFSSPLSNVIRERDISFTIQGMLAEKS